MMKKCQKCGNEYPVGTFSLDAGLCGHCKPGFFGAPLWMQPVQAATRDLWRTVLVIHVILFVLFGLILDGGQLSLPGSLYCQTVVLYLCVRFVVARFRGYPILTKTQAVAFLTLPGHGLVLFLTLFYWAQRLRWGT